MGNQFTILARFLHRYGDDVEGRSMEAPTDEVQQKLKNFAGGNLSEAERKDVIALLQSNPQWVPLLAKETKALRNGA